MLPQDLITSSRVRKACGGICDMTLWRWRRDPDLQFPEPVTIRGRNFYRADQIAEFIERQSSRTSYEAA